MSTIQPGPCILKTSTNYQGASPRKSISASISSLESNETGQTTLVGSIESKSSISSIISIGKSEPSIANPCQAPVSWRAKHSCLPLWTEKKWHVEVVERTSQTNSEYLVSAALMQDPDALRPKVLRFDENARAQALDMSEVVVPIKFEPYTNRHRAHRPCSRFGDYNQLMQTIRAERAGRHRGLENEKYVQDGVTSRPPRWGYQLKVMLETDKRNVSSLTWAIWDVKRGLKRAWKGN